MRIDPDEFRARPLRVHALLHDVPLQDAWAIPLSGGGAGRTIEDLRAVMSAGLAATPVAVRGLFWLRGRVGALFGWDDRRPSWGAESYADRLSPDDRARSLVTPGTADGKFSLLYRFGDEQLSELRNATVHAFLSLSIRPAANGYLAYLGIFVRPVHRFSRLYMAAITPFRRLVVYPALIRQMQSAWAGRYAEPSVGQPPPNVDGQTSKSGVTSLPDDPRRTRGDVACRSDDSRAVPSRRSSRSSGPPVGPKP